ncbi:uroporphyrinogen-III synthase [Stenotrophomonas tumulicola]|uniref:Uroporphyrinogen-III synthase n=1 Tax=Stenotrophomonas tumulicola TaxID=1685415 RepID=A0A7W3IJ80_9GAMM|nr:uroporphyrinogen-III synthase [Stenotrophomonas tumulicola]MBA8683046.1 uroporphyrinogen-III synthase [Stenotrophomonas tumulicola]
MPVMDEHAKPCGWTLVSLRPQGQHAVLRAAAAMAGGRLLALSPWRLQQRRDPASRQQLQRALQASRVIFTSPAAVVAAAARGDVFRQAPPRPWLAVGEGTLRALQAAGIDSALAPARMDSEGLLALPALADVRGQDIGLVTAPGGRGLIAAELHERGARVLRADVYQRLPLPLHARSLARLSQSPQPWILAVSSGEALQRTWAGLSSHWQVQWQQRMAAVVASDRLHAQARALGLRRIERAPGPTALQMLDGCRALLQRCEAS